MFNPITHAYERISVCVRKKQQGQQFVLVSFKALSYNFVYWNYSTCTLMVIKYSKITPIK